MKEYIELASNVKIQVGEHGRVVGQYSQESEISGCNHTFYIEINAKKDVDNRVMADALNHCADSINAIARKLRQDCE